MLPKEMEELATLNAREVNTAAAEERGIEGYYSAEGQ